MREKTRQAIENAVALAVDPIVSRIVQGIEHGAGRRQRALLEVLDSIQPASVDLTQEMADDIVRKIHGPLTISQEFSDTLKSDLASHHDWWQAFPFGYGGDSGGRLEMTVKTNGSIYLRILDSVGALKWQGTFVPPDMDTAR